VLQIAGYATHHATSPHFDDCAANANSPRGVPSLGPEVIVLEGCPA
jgi:hypothetical protein